MADTVTLANICTRKGFFMMNQKQNLNICLLIMASTLLIATCISLCYMFKQNEIRQDALTLAQNGYETYYNGQKIDYRTIDFNHYSVTIDDMNKFIILSNN